MNDWCLVLGNKVDMATPAVCRRSLRARRRKRKVREDLSINIILLSNIDKK